MIKPTVLSEYLLFSTIRIETRDHSGNIGIGTGFFYDIPLDSKTTIPIIITNKHVVQNALTGSFKLHEGIGEEKERKPSGNIVSVGLDNFHQLWIPHPREEIDLCAMLYQPLRLQAESKGKTIYNIALHRKLICTDDELMSLCIAEDVFMVGYPIGLWDEVNNLPVMRKGTTASHPALDFNGKSHGVVDIAAVPGSSGSPIIMLNQGMYFSKGGAIIGDNRNVLLGVLFSLPVYKADGTIEIQEIPTEHKIITSTHIPIHLGYYIKAKEILELASYIVSKYQGGDDKIEEDETLKDM